MPPITMRSNLQVISMAIYGDGEGWSSDGDGGGGAAVPLSLDEMDLRSVCDSFLG
jgi:hypothetical protein